MYWDLLPKIKNACMSGKETISSPFSKFDFEIAKLLVKTGYLKDAVKKTVSGKMFIKMIIKYKGKSPIISGFKIISKPSRHIYIERNKIKPVKRGYGVGFLSTSRGIMTDKEAVKNGIGGEYLFEIW